ncbi:MAG: ATP synthase F0 subunit A [Epsilonproteobacteria bacterium]|nr:MAG: ATP synthase F0 subunit A [Campylobacterota bacterium]RLA65718.1 MAG: ATP synthase F0 subunit A [Campylobacterota bacterium]
MRKILPLIATFFTFNAQASGGFTWISSAQHMLGTHIPEYMISFTLVGVLILVVGLLYRAKLAKVKNAVIPDKGITLRNISEAYGNFIYGQCKAIIGESYATKYFSIVAYLFLMILISNLIGLVPGFLPPTEYLNATLALGIFSFVVYNIIGVKENGFVNYIKHFAGPLWYMAILVFPIEIISNVVRPLSLALRLRGNMFGDHLVLAEFTKLVPAFVPMAALGLGLLVCFIQAYVFTVLSMVYITLALPHDHGEHAH